MRGCPRESEGIFHGLYAGRRARGTSRRKPLGPVLCDARQQIDKVRIRSKRAQRAVFFFFMGSPPRSAHSEALITSISDWVRYQTRVSNPFASVLHFRTVGNCSSERRFGGILRLLNAEVNTSPRITFLNGLTRRKYNLFWKWNKPIGLNVSPIASQSLK
jgi:hypothetical protein